MDFNHWDKNEGLTSRRFKPFLWKYFANAARSGRSQFDSSFLDISIPYECKSAPQEDIHKEVLYGKERYLDLSNRELTQDERDSLIFFTTTRDLTDGPCSKGAVILPRKTKIFNAQYIDGYRNFRPIYPQDLGVVAIASVPALSVITLASLTALSAVLIKKVSKKKARHNATKVEAGIRH